MSKVVWQVKRYIRKSFERRISRSYGIDTQALSSGCKKGVVSKKARGALQSKCCGIILLENRLYMRYAGNELPNCRFIAMKHHDSLGLLGQNPCRIRSSRPIILSRLLQHKHMHCFGQYVRGNYRGKLFFSASSKKPDTLR